MLEFPAPPVLIGDNLAAEIEAALGLPADTVGVSLAGSTVRVSGLPDEQTQADRVAALVAAHTGAPTPAQQEVAAAEEQAETSRARLRELRRKGWANLTAGERNEIVQRVLYVLGR